MHFANVERGERSLAITWADQSVTEFPFIWLRDNDQDAFHPDAGERIPDLPDMAPDILHAFYPAYRQLMLRIRDPRYAIRYSLSPGDMVAFDNRRVLHGRTAFDAGSGHRHLYRYYIEQNEIDSRIRVLSRTN